MQVVAQDVYENGALDNFYRKGSCTLIKWLLQLVTIVGSSWGQPAMTAQEGACKHVYVSNRYISHLQRGSEV